jgi:hypothetical protein
MKFSIPELMRSALLLSVALFLAACGGGGSGNPSGMGSGSPSGMVSISATATTTAQSLTVGTAMADFTPLTPSGGAAPYTYSITTGTLPAGLSLNTSTGAVSGTPTATYATANVVFSVQDTHGVRANTTSTVSFTVGAASATLTATETHTPQNLTVGMAMTSFSPLTPSGGTAPYTYSITSGTLPTGLSLDASTGAVTGTPTAQYATATLIFSVRDANGVAAITTSSVIFTVVAAPIHITATATLTAQKLTVGTAMASFSPLTPSGGAAPYTYSITSGTLPAGLSLNASTGAVTGTPTAPYATANVVFSVKDANNVVASTTNTVIFTVALYYYNVGGNVSLLNGSMVLQNNMTDNLTVSVNGPFTFPTTVAGTYSVSVLTQPTSQKCFVANSTGNATANVGNVSVSCASQMGGAMQGIALNLVPTVSTLASGFILPLGITSDGTNLYVADRTSHRIRKIVIATGVVTTLAGTGAMGAADGDGATATFQYPSGITTDGANLYVADMGNNKIRKIVIATGFVSSLTGLANTAPVYVVGMNTAVDGPSASATFSYPEGLTTDGTNLYVADLLNHKIRKVVIATGDVSSLTGVANTAGVAGAADGTSMVATFNQPLGITTDGTNLYVADTLNNKIRKVVIATGDVSSLTGVASTPGPTSLTCTATPSTCAVDGTVASATFHLPSGITTDGSNLYVADTLNNKIRKIEIATGIVSSLTGGANIAGAAGVADGTGAAATFYSPSGITSDGANLYVTDRSNNTIRQIQ